jgi:hypothetical protein
MFGNKSVTEAPVEAEPVETVALSVLALDLPELISAPAYLSDRNIVIVSDDIGRPSISHADARRLFDEKHEAEARRRETVARIERQAVEADQQRRARIWTGIPVDHLPPGVAPAAAMLQAAHDAQPRRESPLQHALANSGEMTYHSYQTPPDEAS